MSAFKIYKPTLKDGLERGVYQYKNVISPFANQEIIKKVKKNSSVLSLNIPTYRLASESPVRIIPKSPPNHPQNAPDVTKTTQSCPHPPVSP